jgi:hypothetical protein
MSVWDYVIITLGVLQLAVIAWVVIVALRVKDGPIAAILKRLPSFAKNSARLTGAVLATTTMLEERTQSLKGHGFGIFASVQRGVNLDFGDKVTWRSVLAAVASTRSTYASVLGGLALLKQGKTFLQQRQTKNPPGPAVASRPVSRSLADRLGLIPPIAKPLRRVLGYALTGRDVYRELRSRGLL